MKVDFEDMSFAPLTGCANYYPETHEWGFGKTIEFFMQYRTDPTGVADILPEPFMPAKDPIVTVLFSWMENADLVEQGEYAFSGIFIDARFDGENDHYDGRYVVIMPENNNYTTLIGRDSGGYPVILCDLAYPYSLPNGKTLCECRSWAYGEGKRQWQPFYGLEFGSLEEADEKASHAIQSAINSLPLFTIKVIPKRPHLVRIFKEGYDLFSPQITSYYRSFRSCWTTKECNFKLFDELDNNLLFERRFVKEMKKLPVLELLVAAKWHADINFTLPSHALS